MLLTFCLKCKKDTENVDSKMFKTKNSRRIFIIKIHCKGLLSSLGLRIPISKIPLLGDILF